MAETAEHSWFSDQIAAYVAGGLAPEDRERFESHASECEICAAELNAARELEEKMSSLFAATLPARNFEDQLIAKLRETAPRLRIQIHPSVKRAAVAAAAFLFVGTVGYVANKQMQGGSLPGFALLDRVKAASNLRKIGQAIQPYSNENKTAYPRTIATTRTVSDLIKQSRRLTDEGKYQQALTVVDQLSQLDPANEYATGVRPLIEDRAQFQQQRERGELSAFSATGRAAAGEVRIPYSDILIYPENWPDLSKNGGENGRLAKPSEMAATAKDDVSSSLHSLVRSQDITSEVFTAPSSNAEKWDFGGGANTALTYSNWNSTAGVLKNLSYSYQNPYPDKKGKSGESKLNESLKQQLATDAYATRLPVNQPTAGTRVIDGNSAVGSAGTVINGPNLIPGQAEAKGGSATLNYFAPHEFALGKVPAIENEKQNAPGSRLPGIALTHTELAITNQMDLHESTLDREQTKAAEPAVQQVQQQQQPQPQPQPSVNVVSARKVIRNGEMEFEVESFDSTLMNITKITAEEGGFVATTNSEKLPNGKVKGEVVVRVAPDHLDVLVLKLRALGDLKRQNLVANDITKQYTDLDSQLRAAKAMQERLLDMIKSGQGAIKDLLAAEKELGVWREKIEKIEGEMRYYDSQVALSTLSISAYEKDVKSAAAAKQSEQADVGIETEDVEKARADAIKSIDDAKGRIIESELKKFDAGQLAAKIVADVSPDNSGPVIDRLKQLGKVARLEIQRKQTTPDGQTPLPGAKVERGDTRLVISLYNIANIAPRQTTNITIAVQNVEDAYAKIVSRVGKASGRIVTSNINRDKPGTSAVIQFEVKSADADPTLLDVKSTGEVVRLSMSENQDSNNVTAAKQGYNLTLMSLDQVPPREVNQRSVASEDVEKSYRSILTALAKVNARVLANKMETPGGSAPATAYLDFEIRRDNAMEIEKVLAESGDSFNRNVQTSPDTENTTLSKVQYKLAIQNVAALPAKQMTTLAVEVKDVDRAVSDLQSTVNSVSGKVVDTTRSKEASGQTIARLLLDVPFKNSAEVIDKARGLGVVRVEQIASNAQAPDGALARARLAVTVASPDVIVSSDRGIWATIRNGLSTSIVGLMWSLQLIVIGLCLVGPWVLLVVLGWKTWKWSRRNMPAQAGTPNA